MRPVVDIAVEPSFKQLELTAPALLVEAPIDIANQRAFLELSALPQLGAEFVAIRRRPSLHLAIKLARDGLQLRPANSVCIDLVLEEPPLPFSELRIDGAP